MAVNPDDAGRALDDQIMICARDVGWRLTAQAWLPAPIEEVFGFFADASNLQALTPARLKFQILTPQPLEMQKGTRIDYRLRLFGFPFTWTSEISTWQPCVEFVDRQVRGPYRHWQHRHGFESSGVGTLVIDEVDYSVPGGRFVHWLFVRRNLVKIFRYRFEKLRERFPNPQKSTDD